MKILHLIIDHQVISRTIGIYEQVFPNCNDIVAFCERKELKHIEELNMKSIVYIHGGKRYGRKFDFSGYTYIIAHFLTFDMIDFIKSAPSNIHVCWEIYGGDLYSQFLEPNGFNIYYTNPDKYKYHNSIEKAFKIVKAKLLVFKGYWNNILYFRNKNFTFISHRVNSLQWCCPGDGQFVEEYAKRKIDGYEVFNYSLSKVLGELEGIPFYEGTSVLIGSSASYSNNHLYTLELLKQNKEKLKAEHIYLPLSYGGCKEYADEVDSSFKEVYGPRVVAIREYMPLNEYNRLFLDLRSMIFSSWRQESFGNIIMGLYLGIKVFMSIKSPLYKWFLECGFHVYSIENTTEDELDSGLSIEEKKHNRNLIIMRYNDEVFVNTLKTNIK